MVVSNPVGLISIGGELRHRIASTLAEAGLEVKFLDHPPSEDSEGMAPVAVVVEDSGAAVFTKLQRQARDLPLVAVLPVGGNRQDCRATISAGASGAVFEGDIERALVPTVIAAAGGQLAFPEALLRAPEHPAFSRREKQVLGMMVLGFTNQEIGTTLGIAKTTIKSHLSSAFGKLGVSSRAEATTLILDTANGIGLDVLAIEGDEGRGV